MGHMEMLRVSAERPDPTVIARAAACLKAGGLVAFPTETVYGLGASALDATAVKRVFDVKGRPSHDPLIVHVATWEQVLALVATVPGDARSLADQFWPGPLTLVLPRSGVVPSEVTAGLDTVALRMPSHPVARALLHAAQIPIAAPSANLFSRPSPTTAGHVRDDLGGQVDIILDAGPAGVGLESTVVDLSSEVAAVLRPGAVTLESLRALVPGLRVASVAQSAPTGMPMPSPGLLSRHYSPRAPLTLYAGESEKLTSRLLADARAAAALGGRVGMFLASEDVSLLGTAGAADLVVFDAGSLNDLPTVAARLYLGLRELDAAQVTVILAREFPDEAGLGLALRDRLRRAAAGRIHHC